MCSFTSCETAQIDGFSDYFVCNHGTVFSFRRPNANSPRREVPKVLKSFMTGRPGLKYPTVLLHSDASKKQFLVHRLVLECFAGPPPEGMQACHGDGDTSNNCIENLRWGTAQENQADRIAHQTFCSTLAESDVIQIRNSKETTRELATRHGVNYTAIQKIRSGETWKHLT